MRNVSETHLKSKKSIMLRDLFYVRGKEKYATRPKKKDRRFPQKP